MSVFKLESKSYYKVNAAVEFCNNILLSNNGHLEEFLDQIRRKAFDMSDASGEHIAFRVQEFIKSGEINVKYYRSRSPWSKAYGYYTKARPFDVNINTRRMGRSTGSFVATLVHEMVHAIDGLDMVHDYGHGSNSSASKDDTAPYWIGTLASKFYGDEQTVESYPKVVRAPWYKRIFNWVF